MNTEQLKSKILDLLVKGELTAKWRESHKTTESAEELLEKIRGEKEKRLNEELIAKGKKPCAKVEIKEVSDNDKPFEIPESWKWVHIEDITVSVGNKSNQIQTKEILLQGKIPVISQGQDFIDGYSNEVNKAITEIPLILFGDHTRNVKYIDFPFIVGADGTKLMKPILCCEKFIYYLILYAAKNLRSRGYARHYTLLRNELFPLPPLEEQKELARIAETLFAMADSAAESCSNLENLGKKAKSKVLDLLVKGELTAKWRAGHKTAESAEELLEKIRGEKEKRLNEELMAKGKKPDAKVEIKEVSESDKPFEIPESWKWCRLGDIGFLTRGNGIKRTDIIKDGFPCIRYGELYTTYKVSFKQSFSFISKELFEKCKKVYPDNIVMPLTGETHEDIAQACAYLGTEEIAMGGDMACLSHYCDSMYLVYLINSPYGIEARARISTGDIIVHMSNERLADFILPLPPLEEQKEISRVAEILLGKIGSLSETESSSAGEAE